MHLQREGFFISGERIAIDRRNPRFSETEGELLFDEAQQPRVCLRRIRRALGQLHDDGERLTLQGLYTVSQDALRDLDDADVLRLFRSGHLQLAYTIAGSINQLPIIAQPRNQWVACR